MTDFDSGVEELETQNSIEVKRWKKLSELYVSKQPILNENHISNSIKSRTGFSVHRIRTEHTREK